MPNKWIVTERYNFLITLSSLVLISVSLLYFFPNYFNGLWAFMIILGIWMFIIYKWEHIEND